MPTSTYDNRTLTVTLTGSPTQVPWPAGFPTCAEVWATAGAAWNFRFRASEPGFPVASGAVRIPMAGKTLLVDGTGTLTLAVFGEPS